MSRAAPENDPEKHAFKANPDNPGTPNHPPKPFTVNRSTKIYYYYMRKQRFTVSNTVSNSTLVTEPTYIFLLATLVATCCITSLCAATLAPLFSEHLYPYHSSLSCLIDLKHANAGTFLILLEAPFHIYHCYNAHSECTQSMLVHIFVIFWYK